MTVSINFSLSGLSHNRDLFSFFFGRQNRIVLIFNRGTEQKKGQACTRSI